MPAWLAAYAPRAGGATSSSANTGRISSQATRGSAECPCPSSLPWSWVADRPRNSYHSVITAITTSSEPATMSSGRSPCLT